MQSLASCCLVCWMHWEFQWKKYPVIRVCAQLVWISLRYSYNCSNLKIVTATGWLRSMWPLAVSLAFCPQTCLHNARDHSLPASVLQNAEMMELLADCRWLFPLSRGAAIVLISACWTAMIYHGNAVVRWGLLFLRVWSFSVLIAAVSHKCFVLYVIAPVGDHLQEEAFTLWAVALFRGCVDLPLW